jgi:hypothetical protein
LKALFIPFFLLLFSLLSSCGYRGGTGSEGATLSVPYIDGDTHGFFTSALIKQINESTSFSYSNREGDFLLKVTVLEHANSQIGYRRDLIVENGEEQNNIRPSEGRKTLKVQVSVHDSSTQDAVWGPHIFSADADYDYVDQDSFQDLSFTDPNTGALVTVLQFSLGQLEAYENAQDAAMTPLYRQLSQKIIDAISAAW